MKKSREPLLFSFYHDLCNVAKFLFCNQRVHKEINYYPLITDTFFAI